MNVYPTVRNLDPGRLRAFTTVAELGSVTKAADRLNQTQGAISQQIKKLELELGHVLFSRAKAGMALTDQGARLLPDALKLLSANDAIWCSMTSPRCGGAVTIATTPEMLEWPRLSAALRAFSQRHPEVAISLHAASIDEVDALSSKTGVDFILAPTLEPVDSEQSLFVDDYVWAGFQNGRAHDNAPAPVILNALPEAMRLEIHSRAISHGRDIRLVSVGAGAASVIGAIRADIAIGAIPARLRPEDLTVIGPDAGLPPLPQYRLAMHRLGEPTPAILALEAVLREQLSSP